jgi:hypothetical protein
MNKCFYYSADKYSTNKELKADNSAGIKSTLALSSAGITKLNFPQK